MSKPWKTCPKCNCINHDRTRCIECDTDLRKVKPEDLSEPPTEKPCLWKLNDPKYNDYYDTDCKESYTFMHGGPVENMYRYCPGCGRRIKVEVRVEPL